MNTSITSTSETRSAEQQKQLDRLLEDAFSRVQKLWPKKVDPDKEGTQRVLANGDELMDAVVDVVLEKLKELSTPNRYADEEVKSSYGYLSGYTTPKAIAEQVVALKELFPALSNAFDVTAAEKPLPEHAEGYLAIPRWQAIAPTYGEALEKVLELLKKAYKGKFENYREGALGEQHLKLTAKTAAMFERLYEEQSGKNIKPNILVIAAQFGIRHRGRSVRRAREVMFASEFGLDPFTVGIMLLTHPERLQHYDDLWIDCAGADYSPEAVGVFSRSPIFRFVGGGLEFGAGGVVSADGRCGSASGFSPQKE